MKKIRFITLHKIDGVVTPLYVKGYTDGIWNYYKKNKHSWYVIDPFTGRSLYSCTSTRTECIKKTYELKEKFEELKKTERYKEFIELFNDLVNNSFCCVR